MPVPRRVVSAPVRGDPVSGPCRCTARSDGHSLVAGRRIRRLISVLIPAGLASRVGVVFWLVTVTLFSFLPYPSARMPLSAT